MLVIVRISFAWPLIATHIKQYCFSCEKCKRMARSGLGIAPMIIREIKSITFKDVAIDLVGSLENGKGGYRFLLTYICMASTWPEATALKSVMGYDTSSYAFKSIELTVALISDRCEILGVVKILISPYRPQSYGLLSIFILLWYP